MNSRIQHTSFRKLLMLFWIVACIVVFHMEANGQEKPPRPISVTVVTEMQLNFGKFIPFSDGGKVTVDFNGNSFSTGNVVLISSYTSAARYRIDAEPGTRITLVTPDAFLSSSNGHYINLELGEVSTGSHSFTIRNQETYISIGGTLTIGSLLANPPGFYSGTFQITFIQE